MTEEELIEAFKKQSQQEREDKQRKIEEWREAKARKETEANLLREKEELEKSEDKLKKEMSVAIFREKQKAKLQAHVEAIKQMECLHQPQQVGSSYFRNAKMCKSHL